MTRVAAVVGAGAGAVVLLGWMLGIPRLTTFTPSWLPMRPYAAVGFVCLGVALWTFTGRSIRSRVLCAAYACVPLLIGVVTLGEWISGRSLGLDRLLLVDVGGAGARGFLLEVASPAEIAEAVRHVAAGNRYLQPSLGAAIVRTAEPTPPEGRRAPKGRRG